MLFLGFGIHGNIPTNASREKLDEKLWSSISETSNGYSGRRGSLQLWQFLVALLDDPGSTACIAWTGRGLEFKLVEPEEVCYFYFFFCFIL